MPLGRSVFQRLGREMKLEDSAGDPSLYRLKQATRRENLHSGQLIWIGQADIPWHNKKKAFRFSYGEKYVLSSKEMRDFARTPYEGGIYEYVYKGEFKKHRETEDHTDPRGASRYGDGKLFYPNGILYDGSWHHDKRRGSGSISSPTGYRYTGDWCDDFPNGKGFEVFASRAAIDAHYKNGLPEGKGVILYNPRLNAYRYEGDWHNGKRHGKGVIFYANGDTFACTFENGKRHGRGVTTQIVNGRMIQYETQWKQNELVNGPILIPRKMRTPKPVSSIPYRTKGYLMATDITKWTLTEERVDLSFENFMQLKLGFESLDLVGCGFLPLNELRAVWPESNLGMLQRLEEKKRDCVELLDIISAWYPKVAPYHIARFLQEFIHPLDLLRIRGFLNGIEDCDAMGFYHICGASPALQSVECHHHKQQQQPKKPQLLVQHLEASQHCIGGEQITLDSYNAACQLHDPPYLLDVLEVLYPNILRVTLEHYEMEEIDRDIIDAIRVDFDRYAHPNCQHVTCGQFSPSAPSTVHSSYREVGYLLIDDFFRAEEKYREHLLDLHRCKQPSFFCADVPDTPSLSPAAENTIEADMQEGFFKGTVMWILGNCIHLTLPLLTEVENFSAQKKGCIAFDELLRFCFPNARCLRTQELFLASSSEIPCGCTLCKITAV